MASSTRAMARVNAVQQPQKVAATMHQYEMERERMGTTQEMMDDMFEGDAEEEDEADAVVDQIFDEIGVEIGSKVCTRTPLISFSLSFLFLLVHTVCFCCCYCRWRTCRGHAWRQRRLRHRDVHASRPPATRSWTSCSHSCECGGGKMDRAHRWAVRGETAGWKRREAKREGGDGR